jgi:hypothetical protein
MTLHLSLPLISMVNLSDLPSMRLLKGAIVKVHVALKSWVFAANNLKAMKIPIIQEILVLVPLRPPVASPMKRK